MMHVVQFSGGLCSFWAAHRVITAHGKDNVTLLFADTMMEDEDLYRFNDAAEVFLGVKITRLADGRTPWQVMRDEKVIGRSGLDVCSRILKRDLLDHWRFANTTAEDTTFHLGLDWTEGHRMNGDAQRDGMVRIFAPWKVTAPMQDEPIWDKCRMMRELEAVGIALPRLYKLGFPHNNCGGFCIKAGQAHFAQLLKLMPERYAFHEAEEEKIRQIVGDYSVMNDRRGDGKKKVMTLKTFRFRVQAGEDFDRNDWGGCGCSTEPLATTPAPRPPGSAANPASAGNDYEDQKTLPQIRHQTASQTEGDLITMIRTNEDLVKDVLAGMGRSDISSQEKSAIVSVLNNGDAYGYGNLIAWLATAWANYLRESGDIPNADPADFAGGRCYPLPRRNRK